MYKEKYRQPMEENPNIQNLMQSKVTREELSGTVSDQLRQTTENHVNQSTEMENNKRKHSPQTTESTKNYQNNTPSHS